MKEDFDEQIDRTLRMLGSVSPSAGIEERILREIARANTSNKTTGFFRLPQLGFALVAAGMASALIVVGSVSHSRHILPVAPGIHLPVGVQPGVGAASAAHVASQPVTSLPHDRPRSVRKTQNGRAVISPHAKKPNGVTVPKAPAQN